MRIRTSKKPREARSGESDMIVLSQRDAQLLTIDELAHAGYSDATRARMLSAVSAFYRNFQAVTAMSPIQFQKQIRLQLSSILKAVISQRLIARRDEPGYLMQPWKTTGAVDPVRRRRTTRRARKRRACR